MLQFMILRFLDSIRINRILQYLLNNIKLKSQANQANLQFKDMLVEESHIKDTHTIQMSFQNNIITLIAIDNQTQQKFLAEIHGDKIQKQLAFLFENIEEIHSYLKEHFTKGTLKITSDNSISVPLINKPLILKTEPLVASELQSLRAKLKKLQILREEDARTIMRFEEKTREFDLLKHMVSRMQEEFNLFYFQPGAYKKLVFVQDPKLPYRIKGDYLSLNSPNQSVYPNQRSKATSIEAINYYSQPVFSFQIIFENSAGSQTKIGLWNNKDNLTPKTHFKQGLSNFGRGDVLTMTINKQKQSVVWFYNKKVIGRQICDFKDNANIFPFVYIIV